MIPAVPFFEGNDQVKISLKFDFTILTIINLLNKN